jgi:hypothetical protein
LIGVPVAQPLGSGRRDPVRGHPVRPVISSIGKRALTGDAIRGGLERHFGVTSTRARGVCPAWSSSRIFSGATSGPGRTGVIGCRSWSDRAADGVGVGVGVGVGGNDYALGSLHLNTIDDGFAG